MRKATIIFLVIIAVLVLIFAAVMTLNDWAFTRLSAEKYETNTYSVREDFHSISIITDTADILFAVSDDETCTVVCDETEKVKHTATVQDGTLTVQVNDERKWYDYIGIHFGTPKITVSLPKGTYDSLVIRGSTGDVDIPKDFNIENLDISVSTGNIRVENTSAETLTLSVSTGKVTARSVTCSGTVFVRVSTGAAQLTDVTCSNLRSNGSTGDISLQNVIAAEQLTIERSTGDVKLDRCDAGEIFIQTDTGDVKGSLLTEKVFLADSDTGRVDVPKTTSGGKCEIHTDTGNIKITIAS